MLVIHNNTDLIRFRFSIPNDFESDQGNVRNAGKVGKETPERGETSTIQFGTMRNTISLIFAMIEQL